MATYGKKRKGLLSSFSVFQDDKPEQDPNQQRSSKCTTMCPRAVLTIKRLAYTPLGNVKTAMSRSCSRAKLGDESGDGDGTHEQAQSSSLHDFNTTVLRPKSGKSNNATTDDIGKPLSPIPNKHHSPPQEQLMQMRPVLGAKPTNTTVSNKGRLTKAEISAPILQSTASMVTENLSRPVTSGSTAQSSPVPKTSMAQADELQRKITNLITQAAIQEEETKRKAELYAAQPAKLSPYQRSKNALVKATRAVKDRLSSHSNVTPLKTRLASPSQVRLNNDNDATRFYQTEEDVSRGRLSRRIAEGQNLANPKIRALMGDGNIPRKPLPVYESMKSRSLHSGSDDDPFSDGK